MFDAHFLRAKMLRLGYNSLKNVMNTSARFATFIIFGTALWICAQSSPPSTTDAQPSVSEIAGTFTNYQRMTTNVVFVNAQLAMLCAGVFQTNVDAARITFGPHANTGILIYMNKLAAAAFGTKAAVFPVGAAIVKQKTMGDYFDKNGKLVHHAGTGVGGMVKRFAGYNPGHGDWEYFYFEGAGKIESGRISSCVQCHESAKGKDYDFGTWSNTGRSEGNE